MKHGIEFNHKADTYTEACQFSFEMFDPVMKKTTDDLNNLVQAKKITGTLGKMRDSEVIEVGLDNMPDESTKAECFIAGFIIGMNHMRAVGINPLAGLMGLLGGLGGSPDGE